MHDAIQYYRLARHVTDRLAKGPKVITLPAKPNWAQLDMAERIIQKSGNPAKVTFPEGMDRQGAIVESIAQKVDSIRGSLSAGPASKRSEEHTLNPALMRISYAVFCLKNKINRTQQTQSHHVTNSARY